MTTLQAQEEGLKAFTLRLPSQLVEELDKAAKDNNRSRVAEVRHRLALSISQCPQESSQLRPAP